MAKIVLREHINRQGANEVLYSSEGNFVDIGWNDKVSSFEIEAGYARFYQYINYGG